MTFIRLFNLLSRGKWRKMGLAKAVFRGKGRSTQEVWGHQMGNTEEFYGIGGSRLEVGSEEDKEGWGNTEEVYKGKNP